MTEINLPSPLFLNGIEYVPTGEFRAPERGEVFLADSGQPMKRIEAHYGFRIILQRVWKWPPWLKAKWIMNQGGIHYICDGGAGWRMIPIDVLDMEPAPLGQVIQNPETKK